MELYISVSIRAKRILRYEDHEDFLQNTNNNTKNLLVTWKHFYAQNMSIKDLHTRKIYGL